MSIIPYSEFDVAPVLNPVFVFDEVQALPPGATFARASSGTYRNAAGLRALAAVDVPRFHHNVALSSFGLLIERQSTNFITFSSDLTDAGWTKTAAVVATPGGILAPDGTAAQRLSDSGDMVSGSFSTVKGFTVAAAGEHNLTLFGRAGSRSRARLAFGSLVSVPTADYNFATLAVTAGTGAIEEAGVGWQRLTIPVLIDPSDLGGTMRVTPMPDGAGSSTVVTRDGTNNLFLWGAQMEAGSPTSFIPTTAAPATRAADVLTLDWASRGLPDGNITVRYTFDDLTTQDVATTIATGVSTVPINLNRAAIRRAERV